MDMENLTDAQPTPTAQARSSMKALSGMDLQRLATHLGVSVATIYRWRSGAEAPKFSSLAPKIVRWCGGKTNT